MIVTLVVVVLRHVSVGSFVKVNVTVYVPGVLVEGVIAPVEEFMVSNPDGFAEKPKLVYVVVGAMGVTVGLWAVVTLVQKGLPP